MAVTKQQARKVRQPTLSGDYALSSPMSASLTTEDLTLSCASGMLTMQSDGTLAGTYAVSVNGQNFSSPVSFAANAQITYNSSVVRVIRIARTSGSGRMHIAAVG